MKQYPSIDTRHRYGEIAWCFQKLDGSNIRAEWSAKRGAFYKFGSRHRLIDESEGILGRSIPLIREKYEQPLDAEFKRRGYVSAICFFEFFGPRSFAGQHDENDQHDVVLIDIAPFKRGIVPPIEFLKIAECLGSIPRPIPAVTFIGTLTEAVVDSVRSGAFDTPSTLIDEGVVFKHADGSMSKVKTKRWLDELKKKCGDDEALFRKLA